jgi:hypothetical protein
VTLPKAVMGELAEKFGEISLFNQHADFELGSDSKSNSTSPWAIACEPATEPSCADSPLHEHFPYGLCNTSKAHVKCSHCAPGRQGDRLRLNLGLQPRFRLLLGLLLQVRLRIGPRRAGVRDLHDRATAFRAGYRPGYNIYTHREIRLLARPQACRPDRRELTLRRLPRLAPLPGGNTISSSRGANSNRGGDYRLQSWLS